MNIGEAAALAGMPAKTIRYYESVGLIAPAARGGNGYRDYGVDAVQTLRFVHRARSLGFSVADIAGLLALYRDKSRSSHDVKTLALGHIAAITRKIAELEAMRVTLGELARRCHGDERPDCPILADLAGEAGEEPPRARLKTRPVRGGREGVAGLSRGGYRAGSRSA